MKIVFELPFYSPNSGGITESIKFAQKLGAHIRFQRRSDYGIPIAMNYSVGMPDKTFPQCDVCVTYSDNPYTDDLCRLPQVGKVFVYFMSYGMEINRERRNAMHPKTTNLCTTKKVESALNSEGINVQRIGFAIDMAEMYDNKKRRKSVLSLYYHPSPLKRYNLSLDVAHKLYSLGFIDNTISFGTQDQYNSFKKPVNLIHHYSNASKEQVNKLFNESKIFVNTSASEGLSRTPIEATLCGCPSVICDGAIGEIFFDGENCFVAKKDDLFDITNQAIELLANIETYRKRFRNNMLEVTKDYTWDNLIKKFKEVL